MKQKLLFTLVLLLITSLLCKAQIYYGMTYTGGSSAGGYGAIINFDATTNKESVVWNFAGAPSDGASPFGNLVYDASNGLFYGMTAEGGSSGNGTIISFNPSTNKDSVVWNFAGEPSDGKYPEGSLVYDSSNGLFYGMTEGGGSNTYGGIIFSFNPTNNAESIVWSFGSGKDGNGPLGNLIYNATKGLFYGFTGGGGIYSGGGRGGTLISFNPSTNKDSVLWNFGGAIDGSFPEGNLVYDAGNGLYYGTTLNGGINDTAIGGYGTIISFNPATNKESVVWSFAGMPSDGEYPHGSLAYDANNGLFYAMTYAGGSGGYGAIISFDPATNKDSLVWSFESGTDGNRPNGDLVYDAGNGLFYGMLQWGGTNGTGTKDGTIISFNPIGNTENVVWDFGSGTDGSQPWGDLVLYTPSAAGINTINNVASAISIYPNPTSGQFTIKSSIVNSNSLLEIYNIMGEEVYQSVLSNSQNDIDVSSQPAGLYFVYLKSDEGVEVGKVLLAK